MKQKAKTNAILLFIILLGFFLGIYRIEKESLVIDEAVAIFNARQPLERLPLFILPHGHLPVYFSILHYWVKLFGDSIFMVRFLSFIFYVFSIFLVFKLTKLLFNNYKIALISSFIFSTSTINIYYAQEARMYSMNVFFALLSFLFLVKFFKKGSNKYLFLYTIVSLIMPWLHFLNVFIFVVQILYAITSFLCSKKYRFNISKKGYFLCSLIIALLYAYCYLLLISGYERKWVRTTYSEIKFMKVIVMMVNYFSFDVFSELKTYEAIFHLWQLFGFLFMITLFFYGLYVCFKKNKDIDIAILCTYWFFIPILILASVSHIITTKILATYNAGIFIKVKYVLASSIPYYMLIANGISKIRNKYFFIIMLATLTLISVTVLKKYYTTDKKPAWNNIFQFVNNNIADDEVLICVTDEIRAKIPVEFYIYKYYSKHPFRLINPNNANIIFNNLKINGIWQLGWNRPEPSTYTIERYLGGKFYIKDSRDQQGISIFHFRRK